MYCIIMDYFYKKRSNLSLVYTATPYMIRYKNSKNKHMASVSWEYMCRTNMEQLEERYTLNFPWT